MATEIKQEKWTFYAGQILTPALGRDFEDVKRDVQKGTAQLWSYFSENGSGFVVTRIDTFYNRKELVLIGAGVTTNGKITLEVLTVFKDLAKQLNIKYIRCHTEKPAMERLLMRSGFKLHEKVLLWEVNPVPPRQLPVKNK